MQLTKLRLIQKKKGIYLIERFAFGLFFFFQMISREKFKYKENAMEV